MTSPYTPPDSEIRGGGAAVDEPAVFSLAQRLGRLRFCCYGLGGMVVLGLLGALAAILAGHSPDLGPVFFGLVILCGIFFFFWYITLMVRRMHDMDRSGFWVLLMLVPGVNFLLWFWMLVGAPSPGSNRFGPPLVGNSLSVVIFGGIAWVFSMLSVVINIAMLVMMLVMPGMSPGLEQWFGLEPGQLEELRRMLEEGD